MLALGDFESLKLSLQEVEIDLVGVGLNPDFAVGGDDLNNAGVVEFFEKNRPVGGLILIGELGKKFAVAEWIHAEHDGEAPCDMTHVQLGRGDN